MKGGGCVPCSGLEGMKSKVLIGTIVALVVCLLLFGLALRNSNEFTGLGKTLQEAKDAIPIATIKQIAGFVQMSAMLQTTFEIKLPPYFTEWAQSLDFMKFEIM